MLPVIRIVQGVVIVVALLRPQDLLYSRKDVKAYKKALASSRAREMYLAKMIDDNGIDLSEFDRIALTEM